MATRSWFGIGKRDNFHNRGTIAAVFLQRDESLDDSRSGLHSGNSFAHNFFGNNTGSSAAGAFVQPSFLDLSGSPSVAQTAAGMGSTVSVLYATNYAGADAGAKINACIAALPAGGGICDARGLTGAQALGTPPINIPNYVKVILGNIQLSSATLPIATLNNSSALIGNMNWQSATAGATQLLYTGTGDASNAAAIQCATTNCNYDDVENLHIRHTTTAASDNSYGVNLWNVNNSTFRNVSVSLFDRNWNSTGVSGGSYYDTIYDPTGQAAYSYDYYIGPNSNSQLWIHPLQNTGGRATETGFLINSVNSTFINPDSESSGNGSTGYYIGGRSDTIIGAYEEGNTTSCIIDANANLNVIMGGSHMQCTDNSPYWENNVMINPGAQITASPTSSFGGYPNFWKSNIYQLGNTGPKLELFGSGGAAAWTNFAVISTLSRTSNVVSVTSGAFQFTPAVGDSVDISGTSPAGATTFDGHFTVASVTDSTHFTYNQTAADDTATGGWAVTLARGPQSRPVDVQLIFPNQTVTAGSCTVAATIPMPGLPPSGVLFWGTSYDLSASAGWGTTPGLHLFLWPTTNTVNWRVCNQTGSNITSPTVTFEIAAK